MEMEICEADDCDNISTLTLVYQDDKNVCDEHW